MPKSTDVTLFPWRIGLGPTSSHLGGCRSTCIFLQSLRPYPLEQRRAKRSWLRRGVPRAHLIWSAPPQLASEVDPEAEVLRDRFATPLVWGVPSCLTTRSDFPLPFSSYFQYLGEATRFIWGGSLTPFFIFRRKRKDDPTSSFLCITLCASKLPNSTFCFS